MCVDITTEAKALIRINVKEMFNLSSRWGLSGKSPTVVNVTRMSHAISMEPVSQGEWTGMHIHEQ